MINRVVLMGRLVADPELKTTNTGISVTSFRIAVDRSYVKAGAERQADFFDIVAWRSSAEFVCRNFSKGSLIAIDGQLQSRQYQTKDGQNRTAIEVVADNVSFTGERRDTSGTYGGGYSQTPRANVYGGSQAAPEPSVQQPPVYSAGSPDDFQAMPTDDDLPF
ncbi:MAG: single-stranded DNA-binding protein [Ruminococcus sp.]|nr:single-stranded DNA-binding protein [Ruminococcus sp.]